MGRKTNLGEMHFRNIKTSKIFFPKFIFSFYKFK